ncbi:hypothetical protein ADK52_11135, partial [Streptomyces sp. WM6372]
MGQWGVVVPVSQRLARVRWMVSVGVRGSRLWGSEVWVWVWVLVWVRMRRARLVRVWPGPISRRVVWGWVVAGWMLGGYSGGAGVGGAQEGGA